VSFVGPSGCGKSTLLNIIAGLLPPSSGTAELYGEAITSPSRRMGFMFQTAVLLPWRTVEANVLLPAEVYGLKPDSVRDKARSVIEAVGLKDFIKAYPKQLSGGEVPLVRAVLRKAGLGENDVKILPVGEGSALTVQALQSGQVNAYSSSLFDVAAIEAAGHPMQVILPPDAQLYPANGIATTAENLNKKRDQIIRFTRAVAKGIAYVKANPDRALQMAKKLGPEEFENEKFITYGWKAIQTLTTPPPALKDQPIGAHYTEGFKNYHDFLRAGKEEEGALPKDVDLTKALDSSLLKDINNFDRAALK
jgi:hypothetical protein